MKPTIRLGRVRGVPLGAHWSVVVILALVADMLATSILPASVKGASTTAYWTVGVLVALAFLLSLVAHEAAHAIVARRSGMKVNSITLWMLGGVTALEGEPPDARSDLRIAIVGPAVSIVCGVLSAAAAVLLDVSRAPAVFAAGFVWLAVTNVVLAVFNLLPGAPLDGGRVVRALIWRRTGDRDRAELSATRGGRATGIVLIWLGIAEAIATANILSGLWLMLLGWFLFSAASAEWQATVSGHALGGLTVGDVMQTSFTYIPGYQAVGPAARRAVDAEDDYFPVCDFEGRLVAIVGTDRLVQAVEEHRLGMTVLDVAVALRPNMVAAADELLVAALRRAGSQGLLAVLDGEQLIGMVTPAVVRRALRRGLVGAGSPALVSQ
ncbi:MAG TPA: site-2 protease family protein [Mycobacteriales bacterium]|jgi:Zn-dependent protease|nr:site-2 protease family protein [Mycobacteriales bacterium]